MRDLYEELIQAVTAPPVDFPEKRLSGFAARRGTESTGQLMVVGRSVHGWGNGWDLASLEIPSKRSEFFDRVLAVDGRPVPSLGWSAAGVLDKRQTIIRSVRLSGASPDPACWPWASLNPEHPHGLRSLSGRTSTRFHLHRAEIHRLGSRDASSMQHGASCRRNSESTDPTGCCS